VKLALDHLVVAARSLAEGMAWCEAVLGVTPGPGGKHDFMGTHNRLFSIASPAFPRAYFEIIAIDPEGVAPATPRWFDLDQAALQSALAGGPRLVHWMARTGALARAREEAAAAGVDIGAVQHARRHTDHGPLNWQIAIRSDGVRLFGGAFPGLIEWGPAHPTDRMSPSGVQLERIDLRGLAEAMRPWWPDGVHPLESTALARGAPLEATLSTPRGPVRLVAPNL
jgi:Glyoxalase-like domain